jgi:hypothetical protein
VGILSDYLKTYDVIDWEYKLHLIRGYINMKLEGYPNFAGVDFCDVRAGGIQIRGHHALLTEKYGYTYPEESVTINYDFSNLQEAAEDFVELWEKYDTKDYIDQAKRMYEDFIRYGTE